MLWIVKMIGAAVCVIGIAIYIVFGMRFGNKIINTLEEVNDESVGMTLRIGIIMIWPIFLKIL